MDVFESFTIWKIPVILSRLSCYLASFALILLAIMVIFSGTSFLLSRGNPEGFNKAKRTFFYSLLGGLIVYTVYTIILSLAAFLIGSSPVNLPWVPLTCG